MEAMLEAESVAVAGRARGGFVRRAHDARASWAAGSMAGSSPSTPGTPRSWGTRATVGGRSARAGRPGHPGPCPTRSSRSSCPRRRGCRRAVRRHLRQRGHQEPRPGRPAPDVAAGIDRAEAGMALCGGNGMGFLNLERRLRACGFYEPKDLPPGGHVHQPLRVGVLGAAAQRPEAGFNLVVSRRPGVRDDDGRLPGTRARPGEHPRGRPVPRDRSRRGGFRRACAWRTSATSRSWP